MRTEQIAGYRIIEHGAVKFPDIELGVPMTITALDALTETPSDFTILPIGRYEGLLPTVAFRIIGSQNFNFSLFGQEKRPFQLPDGAEFIATSSGNLIDRLDLNHYDKGKIQVGSFLDLGFEFLNEDQIHTFAAKSVSRVSFGEKVEGFNPPDLNQFFEEIEAANRR